MDYVLVHEYFVAFKNLLHDYDGSVFSDAFLESYQLLQISVRTVLEY